MTDVANETVLLAFKVDSKQWHVFAIKRFRVRTEYTIKLEDDGEKICSCAMFRHKKEDCPHWQLSEPIATTIVKKGEWKPTIEKSIDEGMISYHDAVNGRYAIIDQTLPNLSLWDLLMELVGTPKVEHDGTFLNPKRIYTECQKSLEGLLASDKKVIEAGLKAPSFKPSEELAAATSFASGDDPFSKGGSVGVLEAPVAEAVGVETAKISTSITEAPTIIVSRERVWKKTPRPDPKYFYVDLEVWRQVLYSLDVVENILLVGPTGVGKSELVYYAANALKIPLEAFNCGASTEPRIMLIGATHFDKEKGTWFNKSRFVRSVEQPRGVVLLDEITRATQAANNILLPLMDRQGYLALDESEDAGIVRRGKEVVFAATANIGMEYTGTEELDLALKRRHPIIVEVGFPPKDEEVTVLVNRCKGLSKIDAKILVEIASRQRDLAAQREFESVLSTAYLIAAGRAIGEGMEFEMACKVTLENHFSNEGGDKSERVKLRQVIQRGGKPS